MTSLSDKPRTIFFIHVPKCAGTSLSVVLSNMYSTEEVYHIDNSRYEHSSEEFRQLPAQEKDHYTLVDGHMYYGLCSSMPHKVSHVTMLRDPVKRLVSLYNYGLQTPGVGWRTRMLKEKPSFVDFIKGHYTNTADNGIARFLSGQNLSVAAYGHCGPDTAEQAIANLKNHFCAIGFLEEFDQSMVLFKHVLGWRKQPLYKHRNVTPRFNWGDLKLLKYSQLTERDLGQIEDYVRWDKLVHQGAKEIYLDSLRQIPDFEEKLKQFKEENQAFQKKRSLIGYLKAKKFSLPKFFS
ncbi:MAG: sulfotransferase family 2 domain-containing protein [Cyanobacteriota bacterium]